MKTAYQALLRTDWLHAKLTRSATDQNPRKSHEQVMNEAQAIIDQKRLALAEKPRS